MAFNNDSMEKSKSTRIFCSAMDHGAMPSSTSRLSSSTRCHFECESFEELEMWTQNWAQKAPVLEKAFGVLLVASLKVRL
ncbi:hypothetical protein SESBI_22429 [Sesbania bispinosa]|nr:hypothetical protein SESBI_22429 [Sesbania bispinosa]